jgi:hypothetical protein
MCRKWRCNAADVIQSIRATFFSHTFTDATSAPSRIANVATTTAGTTLSCRRVA